MNNLLLKLNLKCVLIAFLLFSIASCTDTKLNQIKEFAGDNWQELEKVLDHYKKTGEKQKFEAAHFLISNMIYEKYSYEGEIIQKYDKILQVYEALRQNSVFVGDPKFHIFCGY